MASAKFNITLDEGSAWSKRLVWTDANNNPVNLLNYFVRASCKKAYTDVNASIMATTHEASAGGSIITTTPANGIIDVIFSAADVASAVAGGMDRGVWDLEVVPPKALSSYGGNYTQSSLSVQTGAVLITANHSDAAFDTFVKPDDKVVIANSTIESGLADGLYQVFSVSATLLLCVAHLNTKDGVAFVGDLVTLNPNLVLIKPDEAMAQRLIGGNCVTSKSVTTEAGQAHGV
tara:strand:+ start:14598 stop:15296 length:699 start_codon:yes stop_codon:yes gene_type:complete